MGMTHFCLSRSGSSAGRGVALDAQGLVSHDNLFTHTLPLGWKNPKSRSANRCVGLDLFERLISLQPGQFTCKFRIPRAIVLVNKAEAALEAIQCHSHYCHHICPLVTSQSHTCEHSRGVDMGAISQLEECQGHLVKARVCELEDSCSYF